MGGVGILIKTVGTIGGRVLGRVAGPLGAVIAIGELGYLGLKYSGTLENFKKLYCDKCRTEIPKKRAHQLATDIDAGEVFDLPCPSCQQAHRLARIDLLCANCRTPGKPSRKIPRVSAPPEAKFLFFTCPKCHRAIKFAKNKAFTGS